MKTQEEALHDMDKAVVEAVKDFPADDMNVMLYVRGCFQTEAVFDDDSFTGKAAAPKIKLSGTEPNMMMLFYALMRRDESIRRWILNAMLNYCADNRETGLELLIQITDIMNSPTKEEMLRRHKANKNK